MPDVDYSQRRGLDKRVMLHLASCQWIRSHQNVLITGPTGVGKTYVARGLAHKACLENFRVRKSRGCWKSCRSHAKWANICAC